MPIYNPPPTAVPTAHHTTHETGGTDIVAAIDGSVITTGSVAAARGGTGVTTGLTVLNASNVTTGTLPDAVHSSNIPLKNATNIFTASVQKVAASTASLHLSATASPADQRDWRISAFNDGNYYLQAFSDVGGVQSTPLVINRSGELTVAANYYEKGRTTPMGHWIDVPFNAANFQGYGGSTWTVASGNIIANAYSLVGKTLIWTLYLTGTTVGGTVQTYLTLTVPGGFTGGIYHGSAGIFASDAGGSFSPTCEIWNTDQTKLLLRRITGGWSGATDLRFTVPIRIV